jgi:uncharacterized UBP type Zn finger protein
MAQLNQAALETIIGIGLDPALSRKALLVKMTIDLVLLSHDVEPPLSKVYGDVTLVARKIELLIQEKSLIETKGSAIGSFKPRNPEEYASEGRSPVGLKNVGNTSYFNSLIQTYFSIPEFIIFKPHSDNLREQDDNPRRTASIHLSCVWERCTLSKAPTKGRGRSF